MELRRGPLGMPGISKSHLTPALSPPDAGREKTKWEWMLLAGAFYAAVFRVARNLERLVLVIWLQPAKARQGNVSVRR